MSAPKGPTTLDLAGDLPEEEDGKDLTTLCRIGAKLQTLLGDEDSRNTQNRAVPAAQCAAALPLLRGPIATPPFCGSVVNCN